MTTATNSTAHMTATVAATAAISVMLTPASSSPVVGISIEKEATEIITYQLVFTHFPTTLL